jgi:hypothetical protein
MALVRKVPSFLLPVSCAVEIFDAILLLGRLEDAIIVPGLVWLALRLSPQEIIEECRTKTHCPD